MRLSIFVSLSFLLVTACDTQTTPGDQATKPTRLPDLSAYTPILVGPAVDLRGSRSESRQAGYTRYDAAAAECSALVEQGAAAIGAARQAAGACQVDADCTVGLAETSCGGEIQFPISFAGRAAFDSEVARVEQEICGQLGADCAIAVVDTVPVRSVCVEARCHFDVAPTEGTCSEGQERPTLEGCLDCGLAENKARIALDTIVRRFDACESDDDCAIVADDTGCSAGCGVAIAAAHAGDFHEALGEITAEYCTGGSCPYAAPGCLPQAAVCDAGRCAVRAAW